jgi:hypothetical protein
MGSTNAVQWHVTLGFLVVRAHSRHSLQRKRRRLVRRRLCLPVYEAFVLPLDTKFKEAEFMQYRNPVGFGPSSNTWPRWA